MKAFRVILWSGILLCLLSGCFHLRNRNDMPPALQTLFFQAENPYDEFTIALRESFRASGVLLVETPLAAPVTFYLAKPQQTIVAGTIGTSNQTRIYSVTYTAIFSLKDAHGIILLPPQSVSVTRNLTLSANQLIESNNQLNLLLQQMYRDVISNIYNRLQSEQVRQILLLHGPV